MRLLLDTHIALWAVLDSPKLSSRARDLIDDTANTVAVSVVSLWEIAIKHGLPRAGANPMTTSAAWALDDFRAAGFNLMNVTPEHAVAVEDLPRLHADPFDRLLVAQAATERHHLLTRDALLPRYSEFVVRV